MAKMRSRKIMSFLILALGVATAISLGSGGDKKDSRDGFLASIEAIKNRDPFLAYKKSSFSVDSLGTAGSPSEKNKIGSSNSAENLTTALANIYLGEMARKNPNLAGAKTLTLPNESSLEKLIAEQITQGIQSKVYSKKDIRVSETSSASTERAYMESFAALTQKNFKSVSGSIDQFLVSLFEKKNPGPLRNYIEAATAEVSDLLALETPESVLDLHLEILNLWEKKISVYGAFLDSEKDPLRGLVALQSIGSIISENESLEKKLRDLVEKINS